ncbi:hypothetical protein ABB37_05781 [Leptomonas pyrrhocoris]|uniref:Uncharacterized protein n=1 Tax=Leptomonas pyrrhocoris TaxID=157538 RepID=A0A0M9FZV5_LEPPY|nr:hypothetical protein ABB37_05781 [Leptomonas pyrrhocoris]KPA79329.1 hypothetical protein ABB37_05781 [Leptomonas pyrrhocoris]|eukprot:XP_015657768.1 hypothetical protein ABB37_05781 [Leptomonas pyrrhocoris]
MQVPSIVSGFIVFVVLLPRFTTVGLVLCVSSTSRFSLAHSTWNDAARENVGFCSLSFVPFCVASVGRARRQSANKQTKIGYSSNELLLLSSLFFFVFWCSKMQNTTARRGERRAGGAARQRRRGARKKRRGHNKHQKKNAVTALTAAAGNDEETQPQKTKSKEKGKQAKRRISPSFYCSL